MLALSLCIEVFDVCCGTCTWKGTSRDHLSVELVRGFPRPMSGNEFAGTCPKCQCPTYAVKTKEVKVVEPEGNDLLPANTRKRLFLNFKAPEE